VTILTAIILIFHLKIMTVNFNDLSHYDLVCHNHVFSHVISVLSFFDFVIILTF